jgi:hypothetical protein
VHDHCVALDCALASPFALLLHTHSSQVLFGALTTQPQRPLVSSTRRPCHDCCAARHHHHAAQVEVRTEGTIATLIDFTASRLNTIAGDVAFCDLAADPEIFEGPKGECQFDTYRK